MNNIFILVIIGLVVICIIVMHHVFDANMAHWLVQFAEWLVR
ncbi:hypothetical protein [Xenorhabdus sp. SGI246]